MADDDELRERLAEAEARVRSAVDGDSGEELWSALELKARALTGLGERAEALIVTDELLALVERDAELARDRPELLGRSLNRRAWSLRRLGRAEEALESLRATVADLGDADGDMTRPVALWALWTTVRWLQADDRDAESIDVAAELFARTGEHDDERSRRYAALALGALADAHRAAPDLLAAIATRRQLINGWSGVRPRQRPNLLYDHRFMLVRDLCDDDRPQEAIEVGAELIAELEEDVDVSVRERRIADAMRWLAASLQLAGRAGDGAALRADLCRRFGESADPEARRAVAESLLDAVHRGVVERRNAAASDPARELIVRFENERDESCRTALAFMLSSAARFIAWAPAWHCDGVRLMMLGALERVAGRARVDNGRRRLGRLLARRSLLDRGLDLCDAIERLDAGDNPDRQMIRAWVPLRRAMILMHQGRPVAHARAFNAFWALGPPGVRAIVDRARPSAGGRYLDVQFLAAMVGANQTLGSGPDAERTRAAVRTILRSPAPIPTAQVLGRICLRGMRTT